MNYLINIFRIAYRRLKGKIMEQVKELVLGMLPNAGDKKTYPEVYAAIPAELRGQLRKALLVLKAEGKVRQEILADEGNVHNVVRV